MYYKKIFDDDVISISNYGLSERKYVFGEALCPQDSALKSFREILNNYMIICFNERLDNFSPLTEFQKLVKKIVYIGLKDTVTQLSHFALSCFVSI